MDVHTRMQEVSQVVQENMWQAQIKQKIWYDQKACEVNYQPEDQVLCYCQMVRTSSNDNGEVHRKSYGS